MKTRTTRFFDGIVVGAMLMLVFELLMLRCEGVAGMKPSVRVDTVEVVDTFFDTIRIKEPVSVRDTLIRWITIHVPQNGDSEAGNGDTGEVNHDTLLLPVTQKEYTDDSTYTAWVSGYEVSLDSIRVYRQQVFVTKTILPKPAKRWNIGIQGGLYVTPKGIQPGIGVGVCYALW